MKIEFKRARLGVSDSLTHSGPPSLPSLSSSLPSSLSLPLSPSTFLPLPLSLDLNMYYYPFKATNLLLFFKIFGVPWINERLGHDGFCQVAIVSLLNEETFNTFQLVHQCSINSTSSHN